MAVVEFPGSKSITARRCFSPPPPAAPTVLRQPLDSDDTAGFAEGLTALGYQLDRTPGRWQVEGRPQGPAVEQARVFCRDGATTARFLPALAAAGHGEFHFDASSQMRRRPLGPLTEALRGLGVDLVHEIEEGHHPLTIRAHGIKGGHITLDAGLSSQFLTALLLLGPLTAEGLAITVTDLVSAPYVEITTAMMERFGVGVERDGDTYLVPSRPYTGDRLPGRARRLDSELLPGRGRAHRPQRHHPRARIALPARRPAVRRRAVPDGRRRHHHPGVRHRHRPRERRPARHHRQHARHLRHHAHAGRDRPVRRRPGPHRRRLQHPGQGMRPARSMRGEPPRRRAFRSRLGRDWIEIHPAQPRPAHIACHGDHRIAMAFSITGLAGIPDITLDDPGCVKKTFPDSTPSRRAGERLGEPSGRRGTADALTDFR